VQRCCRGSKEQVQTWCRRSGAEVVKRWCRGSAEQQQSRNRAWCATVHGVLVLQRCRGAGGAGAVEMLQRCCRGAAEVLIGCCRRVAGVLQRQCRGAAEVQRFRGSEV